VFKGINKGFKSKLLIALAIGMSIRLVIAPFTEQRYDMYIWRVNQALAFEYHINPFYMPAYINQSAQVFFWSYTPLWLFTILSLYPIYAFSAHPVYNPDPQELWKKGFESIPINPGESYKSFIPSDLPLLTTLIKLPLIIADILIALLLFEIVKKYTDEKKAYYVLWIWLLNPYVIWISSVWGMFDGIPTLFTILTLYFFIKNQYNKSAFCLAIAILFKIYPIILVPVLALIYYKQNRRVANALRYFFICGACVALVSFFSYFSFALIFGQEPFNTSITLTWQLFKGRASPDYYGKNLFFGLTPLSFLEPLFELGKFSLNIPLSPILMVSSLAIILYMVYREKHFTTLKIISYVALTHFAIYLTYSVVNEQYLIWVLPFLLILSATQKKSLTEYAYWGVSILAMLFMVIHYQNLSYFISPSLMNVAAFTSPRLIIPNVSLQSIIMLILRQLNINFEIPSLGFTLLGFTLLAQIFASFGFALFYLVCIKVVRKDINP
jgi:hypothetical protein